MAYGDTTPTAELNIAGVHKYGSLVLKQQEEERTITNIVWALEIRSYSFSDVFTRGVCGDNTETMYTQHIANTNTWAYINTTNPMLFRQSQCHSTPLINI